ncbi:MAG: hypothetical protein WCT01_00130 [Candidatus Shapirobacteria bacterium]|jgi:hypothetical protein
MSKIIFNYKICDLAPECGGISCCPKHAITYSKTENRPVWNKEKCTFCLKCTLPDACPVGAILYAANENQEKQITDTLAHDSRSEEWLWSERFGVQPARFSPCAIELTTDNKEIILNSSAPILIDVWHSDYLDCRLHSPLFSDLLPAGFSAKLYKLNAKEYPDFAKFLNVSQFPSLVALIKHSPTIVCSGPISDIQTAKNNIINLFKESNS